MDLKIVDLMRASTHDVGWLQRALQSAMKLELATLPPYLCGLWCLRDRSSYPATQIKSIVIQEMTHFGLACNMLCATGKQPEVLKGYSEIVYPGHLPGGVVPKCLLNLIPCDPHFQVVLGFPNFKSFALMCAQIEYPEDPVPKLEFLKMEETFPSIGEFYDAILEAFRNNDGKIPYDVTNQRKRTLGLFEIDNVNKAIAAIQQIQQQGEGGHKNPFYGGNQLSHFYAFGELYNQQKYVFDPATEAGDWKGDFIPIPDDQVYKMTPVPRGGYPAPPAEVLEFDRIFTAMLTHLEAAWSAGGAPELNAAIASMGELRAKALDLLGKEMNRTDAPGIYGPQFRMVTT